MYDAISLFFKLIIPSLRCEMEPLATLTNDFQSVTNVNKDSILDAAVILNL